MLRIDIRLEEGLTISGRVVDVEGKAIEGVPVHALNMERGLAPREVRSGEDGRFELKGLQGLTFFVYTFDAAKHGLHE